jgi:hypothetical protein
MRHNHPHGPVKTIHGHQHHIGWNNAFPPIAKASDVPNASISPEARSCRRIAPSSKQSF